MAIPTILFAGIFTRNTNFISSWRQRDGISSATSSANSSLAISFLLVPISPHNWISDVPKGSSIPLRCQLIQFSEGFISDTMKVLAELGPFDPVLEASRRGVLFGADTSRQVAPLMNEVQQAHGVRRIELFMMIVGLLSRAQDSQLLASPSYLPDPSGYMSA